MSSQVVVAYYLHTLSPYIFQFTETWAIRWYGLAYVLGFLLGYLVLRWLANRGVTEIKADQAGDFITYAALLGVMLGGRLGYMLLYDFDAFVDNPLRFFNIMSGGMASHGGIAGLVIFTYVYSRIHRLSWLGLGDDLVVVAPLGICLGRLANFINGELYGRVAENVPWAVQFPAELYEAGFAVQERITGVFPGLLPYPDAIITASRADDPRLQELLREVLHPRHPSQIYQALLEGAALFGILFGLRLWKKNLPHGMLTGLFFILYALFRIAGEIFRERDAGQAAIFGMNPGQFYSLFMIGIGLAFLVAAVRRKANSRASAAGS